MNRQLAIALVGPTASGKTAFALELAMKVGGEIVCMDSTTVYRGFDIGSSKPTKREQAMAPHHLLDILEPDAPFSAGHFVQQADEKINDICKRGKLPIVVGGTYFYLRALQHGMYQTPVIAPEAIEAIEQEYFEEDAVNTTKMHADLRAKDEAAARAIHPNDKYRLVRAMAVLRTTGELPSAQKAAPFSETQEKRMWMKYAMAISRHTLSAQIQKRTEQMVQDGLIEETKKLREKFPKARALASIGYAEAGQFLENKLNEKQLRNEIIEKTRQLAKRQITWLRSDAEIRYIDSRDLDRVLLEIDNLTFALKG